MSPYDRVVVAVADSPGRHCAGEPADIAVLAAHLVTNTAVTGATYGIDGGGQVPRGSGDGSWARQTA